MDGHKAPPPLRSGRRGGMTVVRSAVLADRRLSLKAKGLFAVIVSRPGGWAFSVRGLAGFTGAGRDAVRSALTELEAAGYLTRRQIHRPDGTFGGNAYVLRDAPPPAGDGGADSSGTGAGQALLTGARRPSHGEDGGGKCRQRPQAAAEKTAGKKGVFEKTPQKQTGALPRYVRTVVLDGEEVDVYG